MVSTPYGRDAGHCFKASIPFCVSTSFCGLGDYAFFDSIMRQADAAINFANFDGNNDDTVDAFFFVVVNHGGSAGLAGGFGWTTNDISANGRSVIIASNRSTRNRILSEPRAVYVCSHEWGHMLGAPDLYSDIFGGWGLGSFSVMGNGFPGLRTFPFDPWDRIRFGWVTPTTVTAPLYGQSIPDYLTTGTVYKLPIGANEYFLVTNHKGLSADLVSWWEREMPGSGGILVWHVDETSRSNKKTIDVELAHGLYNFVNYQPDTQNPNDSTGKDSLDIKGTKPDGSDFGYTYPSLASATCWWNSQTKTTFDGMSNPSSDGHGDQVINGMRAQNVPSHLAVRKIQAGNFSSATADLLVNNWFGHLTANTTWGPGVYAITGDITVDSGKTLTIAAGTTVYFQKNEDNQAAGVSTGKSELIVASGGTLIAVGTPGSPIKFLSSSSNPFGAEWYGIRVYGSAKLTNCWIKNAYAGIDYQNTAYDTVRACVFEKNYYFGLQARILLPFGSGRFGKTRLA